MIMTLNDGKDLAKAGLPSALTHHKEISKFVLDTVRDKLLKEDQVPEFNLYSGISKDSNLAQTMNQVFDALSNNKWPEP